MAETATAIHEQAVIGRLLNDLSRTEGSRPCPRFPELNLARVSAAGETDAQTGLRLLGAISLG